MFSRRRVISSPSTRARSVSPSMTRTTSPRVSSASKAAIATPTPATATAPTARPASTLRVLTASLLSASPVFAPVCDTYRTFGTRMAPMDSGGTSPHQREATRFVPPVRRSAMERSRGNVSVRASPCLSVRRRLGAAAPAGGSAVPRSLSPAPLAPATPAIALPPLRRAELVVRAGPDPAERHHDQSDQDEQHRPAPRPVVLQDQESATEEQPDRQRGGHQESQQAQERGGRRLSSTLSQLTILPPVPTPAIPAETVLLGAEARSIDARRPPGHLSARHPRHSRAPAPCPP